jgi:hypothetical protein
MLEGFDECDIIVQEWVGDPVGAQVGAKAQREQRRQEKEADIRPGKLAFHEALSYEWLYSVIAAGNGNDF